MVPDRASEYWRTERAVAEYRVDKHDVQSVEIVVHKGVVYFAESITLLTELGATSDNKLAIKFRTRYGPLEYRDEFDVTGIKDILAKIDTICLIPSLSESLVNSQD